MINENQQTFFGNAKNLLLLCQGISDLVFLMAVEKDLRFKYVMINQAAKRFSGITEDAYGKFFEDIYPPEMADFLANKYRQAVFAKKPIVYEDSYLLPDGKMSGESILTPIFDEQGVCTHVLSITRDITERKRFEEKLMNMAYHDELTGLPNRRLFREELTRALEDAKQMDKPLAIMFLDLDRFKIVNDTLGHDKGDMLLKVIAERLLALQSSHSTIARLGGDEFVVIMRMAYDLDEIRRLAEQILMELERPVSIGQYEFNVTASIGIAVYNGGEVSADLLMKYADQAMYTAKESGKNNYKFYECKQDSKLFPRLEMEHALRKAIEREEFCLHYQPVYHIVTGNIICMEVLLRWQHPVNGWLSPAEFIPVAEETGLIVPIGEWVMMTACRQNKSWQDQGLPAIPIAVNLSPLQFQQPNIVQRIAGVLEETGLKARYLILEITEGMAMHQVDLAINKLHALKEMGIKVSIDDFGTGYSSLNYLKRFPIDSLKIDQSFIKEIVQNQEDAAIVKAIIAMARSLKRKVIAEGVETEEQMKMLLELGCREMQGYLFSKPVPTEIMEEILSECK